MKRCNSYGERPPDGLREKSIKAVAHTGAAQAIKLTVNTAGLVVLARLLTPEEFGLVGMVSAFTAFVLIFRDLGMSTAIVQRPNTTNSEITSLFWIGTCSSAAIALLTVAAAPFVAQFYSEPRLTTVTALLASVVLISGLGNVPLAILRKSLRFDRIAVVETTALVAGLVAAILAALAGASYWSLVIQQVFTATTNTAGVWILAKWRPGIPTRNANVRKMIQFGADVAAFEVVNYFARNLDKMLLGRFHGASAVGLYTRAYQLFVLPMSQIRAPLVAVAIPTLSLLQSSPDAYGRYYRRLVGAIAGLSMPLTAVMLFHAKEIIPLALGRHWIDSVEIFRVLALIGFIQPAETTRGLVMLSLGLSRRYFVYGLARSCYVAAALIVGINWGAVGVATAYVIADLIAVIPSLWFSFRGTPVKSSDFGKAIWRPAISTGTMLIVMSLCERIAPASPSAYVLMSTAVGVVAYVTTNLMFPSGRSDWRAVRVYAKVALSRQIRLGEKRNDPALSA